MSARIRHGREDAKKEKVRGSEERGKRGGKVERKENRKVEAGMLYQVFFLIHPTPPSPPMERSLLPLVARISLSLSLSLSLTKSLYLCVSCPRSHKPCFSQPTLVCNPNSHPPCALEGMCLPLLVTNIGESPIRIHLTFSPFPFALQIIFLLIHSPFWSLKDSFCMHSHTHTHKHTHTHTPLTLLVKRRARTTMICFVAESKGGGQLSDD